MRLKDAGAGDARAQGVPLPGRVGDVRRGNLSLVLAGIASASTDPGASLSRAQLAVSSGLTKASVSSLVSDLIECGLVREVGLNRAGERGRPGVGLTLNPLRGVVGLEINVDYIAAGLVDLGGNLLFHTFREAHNSRSEPGLVMQQLSGLIDEVRRSAAEWGVAVLGGGLAVPGLVDAGRGRVVSAPNLHWTSVDLDLPSLLPDSAFGTILSNEANSAALAELWYGRGRELRDFVFVSGEVGVGAGLVIGAELFVGPRGHAGELGHVVVHPDGPACECGGRGCLETFAGQEAIFSAARIVPGPTAARLAALTQDLADGEAAALAAVERAGHYLGLALVSAARLVDVPAVVLGGHFSLLGQWIRPALLNSLASHAPGLVDPSAVVLSSLQQSAALLGAAGTAIHAVLEAPHVLVAGGAGD